MSVAMLHIQGEATPLRELDPSIPISVEKIVAKCMQKRSERRYHTAYGLIIDLKRSITDPDGDFVEIPAFADSDSPTINISGDLERIQNGDYDSDGFDEEDFDNDLIDSEDDLDSVDSKLDKLYLAGYIVAAVLLFALVLFRVIKFVLPQSGKKSGDDDLLPTITEVPSPTEELTPTPDETQSTYKFPNVINLTEDDARAAIQSYDPDALIVISEDYSDEYAAGRVMEQYPVEGSDTLLRSEVRLKISLGVNDFEPTKC